MKDLGLCVHLKCACACREALEKEVERLARTLSAPAVLSRSSAESTELLPCPHCGGNAEYRSNPFLGDNSMALCQFCGASAYWKKWNKRVVLNEPQPAPDWLTVATALARRLCQLFDSGGESQRSVRARHASAIFQLLDAETEAHRQQQRQCDEHPIEFLEAAEDMALALSRPESK